MMTHPEFYKPLCNFLFILPPSTTLAEQEAVVSVAKRLIGAGYVYLASAHESTMEDRDGIRFMPWQNEQPPAFGLLTGVFVVSDQDTALLAADAYPESLVWLIQPGRDEEPAIDTRTIARRTTIPAVTAMLSAA